MQLHMKTSEYKNIALFYNFVVIYVTFGKRKLSHMFFDNFVKEI